MGIVMNKTKVEIYREVLWDVSQNFKGSENFTKQGTEKICEWKKKIAAKYFILAYFLVFSVIAWY